MSIKKNGPTQDIVMQYRASGMNTFFIHENHPSPSSGDGGKLHTGKKSDLLSVLAKDILKESSDSLNVKLLEGATVVHISL